MTDLFPDVQTEIFTKYLALIGEAIAERDVLQLDDFWQTSLKLGSRGVIMRTLINQGAREIIARSNEPGYRPAFIEGIEQPLEYLLQPQRKTQMIKAIQEKDFVFLTKLLRYDPELVAILEKEFQRIYEYQRQKQNPLAMEELVSFLYLFLLGASLVQEAKTKAFVLEHALDILDDPSLLLSKEDLEEDHDVLEFSDVTWNLAEGLADKIKAQSEQATIIELLQKIKANNVAVRDLLLDNLRAI